METTNLATALELARVHGVRFAASYLCDKGIAVEVAVEVLAQRPLVAQISGAQVHDSQLLVSILEAIPTINRCQAALANVQGHCTPTVPLHQEGTVPDCAVKALLHAS